MARKNLYEQFSHYANKPPIDEDILRRWSNESQLELHSRLNSLINRKVNFKGNINRESTLQLILDLVTYQPEEGFRARGDRPLKPRFLNESSIPYKEAIAIYIELNTGIEIPVYTSIPSHFYEDIAERLKI